MTLRSISWIADSGLLVGRTTIGEFTAAPMLVPLALSASTFALSMPQSGAVLGATTGSTITATGLPAGLTVGPGGWAFSGAGAAGSYAVVLTETLSGAGNSPLATSFTLTVSAPASTGGALDFSQSNDSGLIAALRSFLT